MINEGLNWIEKTLAIVDKYKIGTIFKGIFLLLIIFATVAFINNPTYIFEQYKQWEIERHNTAMEKRIKNNSKIQSTLDKLLYQTNAERVILLELHNGNANNACLPFAKCSATYESLAEGAKPVSNQYIDVNLSLFPFANELYCKKYWCGGIESIRHLDKSLYYKLGANGTEHFTAMVIKGVNKPLAFIFVSFECLSDNHSCTEVKDAIESSALELALLLEIKKEH